MSRLINRQLFLAVATLSIATLSGSDARAEGLNLPAQGWVSWEVTTVTDAPAWCCYDYTGGKSQAVACKLDERQHGYVGNQDGVASSGSARVYALMRDGKTQRLRALDSACPVQTASEVQALGRVDNDLSVAWLSAGLQPRSALSDDLLAAIALHAGDRAAAALRHSAELPNDLRTREQALFWLGQVRGLESADFLQTKMHQDPNPKIREHAAFSLSQSTVPNRAQALIRQAREDSSAQVRAQAWFWLAQTEYPGTEAAITAAMTEESDRQVREQQIFALSQLPDQRASKALIAIIGDPSADQAVRKHALFWLGQSDSDEAYQYLDRLLAGRETPP